MTETTNYGLKLMERADSGNWITGGLNGNTAKIDEVMKQLSDQLTDANGLITGLQNQLDTTNGSMTTQGGQITELGNLINGANGNIATLTQAVEDLQTKQPTGNEYEYNFSDENKVYGIKLVRIGKLVMGTFLYGFKNSTKLDTPIDRIHIPNVPKDFFPFFNSSVLPEVLLGDNMKIGTVIDSLWSATINDTPYICFDSSKSDFLTNESISEKVSEIQNHLKEKGTLSISIHNKISDLKDDGKHAYNQLSKITFDDNGEAISSTIYYCHWWNFSYMAN